MSLLNNITYVIGLNTLVKEHHYKYSTHRDHILPEIKEILSQNSSSIINLIINISNEEQIKEILELYTLELNNQLHLSFIASSDEDSSNKLKHQLETINPEMVIYINQVSLENQVNLNNAIHLIYEIGDFQRNPFKPTFKIVPNFNENKLNNFFTKKELEFKKIYKNNPNQYNDFSKALRKKLLKNLSENLPLEISRLIDESYNNFEKIFLLPLDLLQYNNLSVFDTENLLSFIENIAKNTPANIGLMLTEDTHNNFIDESIIRKLKLKYQNLIYVKNIPFAFEFISSYVDGIIANENSVSALYARIWKKNFLCLSPKNFDSLEYLNFIEDNTIPILSDDFDLLHTISTSNIFIDLNLREKYFSLLNMIFLSRKDPIKVLNYIYEYSLNTIASLENVVLNNSNEWSTFDHIFKLLNISIYPDTFRAKMSQSKVLSFDMFDTLVERDLANPDDLFFLIQGAINSKFNLEFFSFKHFRVLAEENKRRECDWKYEVTLNDIYNEFSRLSAIFTKAQIAEIKNIELAYEIMFVKPKKKMIREYYFSALFVDARNILSDIYLSNDHLAQILKNVGIKDYDHLMSSASYGHLKYTGKLFGLYLHKYKHLNYKKEDFLHVGDNYISDGKSPLSYGLQSYTFNKSIENYKRSCINQLLPPSTHYEAINQSILTGLIANKFYGNHQNLITYNSIFSGSIYNVGYTVMGPLLFGFTQWLYRHVKKHNIDKLFFLSRDGWLLKKCFDLLYPDSGIRTTYLYCSRRAFKFILLKEWHDIIELFDLWFDHSKLSDLLSVRYNILWEEIDPKILKKYAYTEFSLVSRISDRQRTISFLKEISPLILKKSALARKDYISYLSAAGFDEDPTFTSTAIVDIGYGASMQLNFMELFNCNNIHGYYFLTRNTHVTRARFDRAIMEGYLGNFDDSADIKYSHPINNYIQVFESLLSSPEGTLVGIKEINSGEFLFDLVDVENEELRVARFKEIERGALNFITDINSRLPKIHLQAFQLSPLLSSRYLMEFVKNPLINDAKLLCEIDFEDDLTHSSSSLIDMNVYEDKNLNIAKSAWKEGAIAIFGNELNNNHTTGTNLTHNVSSLPSIIQSSSNISHGQRMIRKLKKNPYMFFNDSKMKPLRGLSVLFKPTSVQEKVFTPIINRILK